MVFKKKALTKSLKPKKIRAVRQPRAKASSLQKEQHTHIINVFNTPHGTHNPYISDIPFQEKYTIPYVFSTQKFHVPQQIEPQVLTHNVEPKSKPVELTSKNVFPQSVFQVPTSKPKLSIGGELSASEIEAYQLHNNPYASESEGSPRSPRGPYKSKGKGSTMEKHQNIGRNIQNQYVSRVEAHSTSQQPNTSFMEVKSTTGNK